jgi:hypothetical protein
VCQPERSQTPHILNERRAARRFLLEGVIDFRSTTLIGIEPLERHPAAQQNAMEFAGTDSIFSDGFTSQPTIATISISVESTASSDLPRFVNIVCSELKSGRYRLHNICAFRTSRLSYQH